MQTRREILTVGGAAVLMGSLGGVANALPIGQRAPEWDILEWINGDGGNVAKNLGQVVVIDFFQLWCPGCNSFSGPLMELWRKRFATQIADKQLKLVKIHTVFEGHKVQTVRRLKRYLKEKDITTPVGVDRHIGGARLPETMRRYKTMGTPEMAVIDKEGFIRFQKFGYFEPEPVDKLIKQLMNTQKV